MTDTLKVGDTVQWRGGFGRDEPRPAVIDHMEITTEPRCKYGDPAESVSFELVRSNRVVFGLTNGHWCYAEQIDLPSQERGLICLT